MAGRKSAADGKLLEEAVAGIVSEMGVIETFGRAAGRMSELEGLDVSRFGIVVVTADGSEVCGGECDTPFAIQSISKVFALTMALEAHGDAVWKRVGREPSGDPYNSIVDLERHKGLPRNPFINAGALVVVDMLLGREKGEDRHASVRDFLAAKIGSGDFGDDEEVLETEKTGGFINRSLANLAKHFGNLEQDVDAVMEAYVAQCAIALTCRQLALAGRYLMLDRIDADAEIAEAQARRARRVSSLMLTCGQYDGSGDFAYRVGLPAKSGVAGGILAVAPNVASIAVWSPGLDENGNSLLGTIALERLAERMDWSIFGSLRVA